MVVRPFVILNLGLAAIPSIHAMYSVGFRQKSNNGLRFRIDARLDQIDDKARELQSDAYDMLEAVAYSDSFSMELTSAPTSAPVLAISGSPSESPSHSTHSPTDPIHPSEAPSSMPIEPVSAVPSDFPSLAPTAGSDPTISPHLSVQPSARPSSILTSAPTSAPTPIPTQAPSASPSWRPSGLPATSSPSASPTFTTTQFPTLIGCNSTAEQRRLAILDLLDSVADPILIRDGSSPQGLATNWLINEDDLHLCPDAPKLIQRWVMAVFYHSTGGDGWVNCTASGQTVCGNATYYTDKERFLSAFSECRWGGVSCNDNGCVTDVVFGKCDM